MSSFKLSAQTQGAIQTALTGPGENNQNYLNAYSSIYNDLVQQGGRQFWNAQLVCPGRPGQHAAVHSPLQQERSSGIIRRRLRKQRGFRYRRRTCKPRRTKIADTVFQQLHANSFVFSDNPLDTVNFSPTSIVRDDAGSGLSQLSNLNPGSNLDAAIWAGSLFARTELNDPTYFSDYNVNLTVWFSRLHCDHGWLCCREHGRFWRVLLSMYKAPRG